MDSAQVYRGMDIGTAKPNAAQRSRVPHHLIDVIDPDHAYSSGRWRNDAIHCVTDILRRGRLPLIVGGTMLYYRALVGGLDALPQGDARVRAELDAQAAARGWRALHAELAEVDPRSARRIAPNDAQRVQRALEVWRITGKPISALQGIARQELPFTVRGFSLVPSERALLHRQIAERFDAMLQAGLVNEVEALRQRYALTAAMASMRAVGYRQVWRFLDGNIDAHAMRTQAVAATRQLAKRQLTWLRSFPELEPVSPDHRQLARRLVHSFL